ncbi:MAG TPA: cysteine desulfurase family protein [Candidatus Dormibacteraeota bacterium]|nr:cysteine desulfurase family protein [Candidatus Dormibacteraeota bacterium]
MNAIYMDHAATTVLHPEVLKVMNTVYHEEFGNPSSIHSFGRSARKVVDEARQTIANCIGANEKEIIFTSGGTEADNFALIGTALANQDKGKHIITTKQEHHAVLHSAQYLESIGFDVTYLPVYENGRISIEDLANTLTPKTILVSIMSVNNETGIIQPIRAIGELLKTHRAYFHTDAVQAFHLIKTDVKKIGIDLLTASSHKINGPKGIGFLYVADAVKINALQYGGEQERKRRAGTENVAGIVGFQKAVELSMDMMEQRNTTYKQYKELFLDTLTSHHVHYMVNGDQKEAIPSIVNISFLGTNVETLLTNLDLNGIAASSGSACTAGSIEPSHVLTAMYGNGNERTTNSIRFSFGMGQSVENIQDAAERVAKIVNRLTAKKGSD